jgi:hypothetical protein
VSRYAILRPLGDWQVCKFIIFLVHGSQLRFNILFFSPPYWQQTGKTIDERELLYSNTPVTHLQHTCTSAGASGMKERIRSPQGALPWSHWLVSIELIVFIADYYGYCRLRTAL